jgi:hypothetical protein
MNRAPILLPVVCVVAALALVAGCQRAWVAGAGADTTPSEPRLERQSDGNNALRFRRLPTEPADFRRGERDPTAGRAGSQWPGNLRRPSGGDDYLARHGTDRRTADLAMGHGSARRASDVVLQSRPNERRGRVPGSDFQCEPNHRYRLADRYLWYAGRQP